MEILKSKRKQLKSKLTRFTNYIEQAEEIDVQEVKLRLEKAEELWDQFDTVQSEIELLDEEEEPQRSVFEDVYYRTISKARQHIIEKEQETLVLKTRRATISSSSNNIRVKLPSLNLPIFSGKYTEWLMFRDSFKSTIDQDEGLSNIQKFQYLRGSLRDEALQIIQALETTDDNYPVAWNLLKGRFENKELIKNTHLKNLFELPTLQKESYIQLRNFIDIIRTNISSLKTLKEPVDTWDTMLIYLFNSKLDYKTRHLWQEKVASSQSEVTTFEDFLKFLSCRSQTLEMSDRSARSEITSPTSKQFPSPLHSKKKGSFTATNGPTCGYCQKQHYLFKCETFLNLSPSKRYTEVIKMKLCTNCLKFGHFKQDCRNQSSCFKCKRRHNTLLHQAEEHSAAEIDTRQKSTGQASACHSVQNSQHNYKQILLPTATVIVYDQEGNMHKARALLDSGSQPNFITKKFAEKLKLPCHNLSSQIQGIGNKSTTIREETYIKIKSKYNNYNTTINCLILQKITNNIPHITIDKNTLNLPQNIKLADDQCNISAPIDMLIGAEIFWNVLSTGQIRLGKNQPILQKTLFGWVATGAVASDTSSLQISNLAVNSDVQAQLEKFWHLEEVKDLRVWTKEEQRCEDHFQKTIYRNEEGRFVVSLPLKEDVQIGDSLEDAQKRFKYLERRLHKDPALKENYKVFMADYKTLNHMTEIKPVGQDTNCSFYLPHHPVIKEESLTTKTRVVFDGSHQSNTGNSLNDKLLVGPATQDNLFNIILRFRTYPYVITADIMMMYRQILVRPEDRDWQRIIWREEPDVDLKTFQLNTLTYGTACAPFLATRCLKRLAEEDGDQYPLAKAALQNDFYMDDLLTGVDTIDKAIELQRQLIALLGKAKFQLRKWRANHTAILANLCEENKTTNLLILNKDESIKTLGLFWNSLTDSINYKVKEYKNQKVTKRSILSEIAQIFDPLGLLGPVIIKAKCIMQRLWKLQLEWDETVPQEIQTEWLNYRQSLEILNQLQIPRNVSNSKMQGIEIHGYCDASEIAYGACIYAVTFDETGNRIAMLLCSKSRVAPLKTISVPRLELCGATLLANLFNIVEQSLRFKIHRRYLWSDSTIVLAWIKTSPNLLKTFVANRVCEIQNMTAHCTWNHVNSAENPADIISRGIMGDQIITNKLWWNGPEWLQLNTWPEQTNIPEDIISERKNIALLVQNNEVEILQKYSCWTKLQRVLAYCLRFLNNCRNLASRKYGELSTEELLESRSKIIFMVQEETFTKEKQQLKKKSAVDKSSKLISLAPYLDNSNLIRVGGRLKYSEVDVNQKHPLILPANHHVTNLLLRYEHVRALHCGPEQLLSIMRTNFWPISGRQGAKRIIRNCHKCFRYKPRRTDHLMGNLPKSRVSELDRPFIICGVDYAGPIQIREHKRRGRPKTTKGYMAIFVCFATKAVHIELVSDLTTEAFLAALRRFIARRGICTEIHSDNATNFVGANRQLKEMYQFIMTHEKEIKGELEKCQIKWCFIPPRAPHMGGLWEAAVKATKRHFYKVTQNLLLTYEECATLLTEIEAVLNSRPLTPLSSSPFDLAPLTPAHFLIGDTLLQPAAQLQPNTWSSKVSRWQHLLTVKQHFWNRWKQEYLHTLQQRTKWQTATSNIKVGTLVILIEDNIPPLRWPMGRILETYPGEDNIVRVVLVRTSNGTYKRPVKKVCILPDEEASEN